MDNVLLNLPWPMYLALALSLLILPPIRRWLISAPLLHLFRKSAPRISQTEWEALNAGDVGWEAELFSGKPDWTKLYALPRPELTPEEKAFIDGPVAQFCAMIDDWDITQHRLDLPPEAWAFLKEQGFFALILPRQYGGKDFSAYAHSQIVMKIASRSVTAAVTVMVPNSLGPGKLLLQYGTEQQKQHHLPRLAMGKDIPCFALTGPEAGSDASAIPDRGVVCMADYKGRETLGIRLNWEKRYITLGPIATLLGLAFHLYDPEQLLGDKQDIGISIALIPTDTLGVEIGERHLPLNAAFMNGPNRGHDVFIPMDWLIGGQERAGQGWKMLMESLADGRGISLPALAAGGSKLAARATGAYAHIREQFRLPIGRFEGVEEGLARIAGETYIMDAARTLTTSALDVGQRPAVITAMVKYQLTERLRTVINIAMDIHGGRGICMGPRNYLARTYQTLPIAITVEGANILTRSLIVFGQGAMRAHPWILKELQAAQESNYFTALQAFDHALFGHFVWTARNALRAFFGSFRLHAPWQKPIKGQIGEIAGDIAQASARFACIADLAMLSLGPALKRKESITGRLADALSGLYLASAVLKRAKEDPVSREILAWSRAQLLWEVDQALDGVLANLPNRPLAWILRLLAYPLGRHHAPPRDHFNRPLAELLMQPSPGRAYLTDGIYVPEDRDDPLGRMEYALRVSDPQAYEQARQDAIEVDAFAANELAISQTLPSQPKGATSWPPRSNTKRPRKITQNRRNRPRHRRKHLAYRELSLKANVKPAAMSMDMPRPMLGRSFWSMGPAPRS